jgi:integrase
MLSEYQERANYVVDNSLEWEPAIEIIKEGVPEENLLSKEQHIRKLEEQLRVLKKQEPQPIIPFIQTWVAEKEEQGLSTRHFTELARELGKWEAGIDFNDLSYAKLKEYEAFKRSNMQGRGVTMQKTLRTLKTVYNEARRRGLVYNMTANPWDGFKVVLGEKKVRPTFTNADLMRFKSFKPKAGTTVKNKENMQRAIDIFMFQIYIGGHDYAEVAELRWEDISDGRIRLKRYKLKSRGGGRQVDNVLLPEASKIIKKHGTPGEERVFGWLAHPSTGRYEQQRTLTGRTIRRICVTLELPNFGTKFPRTVFRSAGGFLGVNDLILMQIMGHSPERVTHTYQQDLSIEAQDKAHRRIVDYLCGPDKPSKGGPLRIVDLWGG